MLDLVDHTDRHTDITILEYLYYHEHKEICSKFIMDEKLFLYIIVISIFISKVVYLHFLKNVPEFF